MKYLIYAIFYTIVMIAIGAIVYRIVLIPNHTSWTYFVITIGLIILFALSALIKVYLEKFNNKQ